MLRDLAAHVPREFGRYFEPFLGGGALFFATQPEKAVLSDTNRDLIECYQVVRDEPEHLIDRLSEMENAKAAYIAIRASKPRSEVGRAARFIYLSTLAFNGIYRVNLKGQFNVPYGQKRHLDVTKAVEIRAASVALQGRTLLHADFGEALSKAKKGDFIYLDPPYTVAHENNGFVKYNAKVFSWADQSRLANAVMDLSKKGCNVLATNACHPSIRTLYRGLRQIVIQRPSVIAASSKYRGPVNELIITNIPPNCA